MQAALTSLRAVPGSDGMTYWERNDSHDGDRYGVKNG
jgi:hypothetical protein